MAQSTTSTRPSAGDAPAQFAVLPAVLSALPGLVLAGAGFFHPTRLTQGTAQMWWGLHVPALFAFPLVAVALMALFRGRRDVVAWLAVLAAFIYATTYTALDVISGIGAGFVTSRPDPSAPRPDEVRSLFAIGGPIGEVGSWALITVAVLVALDALRRRGLRGAPGLLLVPGAVLVHVNHIYWPLGALGIALVGIGTGVLAADRVGIRR